DITVERITVTAMNPPVAEDRLISVVNDPNPSGKRARLTVRESFLDGTIACAVWPAACTTDPVASFPQVYGIIVRGDVDAVLERNVIRRTGGACILVLVRDDLGGETNIDILDNDLDECHPLLRGGAIFVGPRAGIDPSAPGEVKAEGKVNIVGNTIRNSSASCRTTTAISYILGHDDHHVFGGQIERNRVEGVVQSCAFDTARARPAGIWLGSRFRSSFYPPVDVDVRFKEIVGNAQAGLCVAANMTATIHIVESCKWGVSVSNASGTCSGCDAQGGTE